MRIFYTLFTNSLRDYLASCRCNQSHLMTSFMVVEMKVEKGGDQMPKIAKELSPVEVKRLTKPGMHAVGGVTGLVLQIQPDGNSRHWIYRSTIGGKRRHLGLGGFPTVTLAMAREMAREAFMSIRAGNDPIEDRKAAQAALTAAQ